MPQLETIHFHNNTVFSGLTGTIDHQNCVVRGISLITSGITATGHDLYVDDQSVNSFHELGTAMKKVPVLLDHGSGIISMNGTIQNFRKDGDKWRGDWHLLKSHDETPVMLERCQDMSECFGFSLAFSGDKQGVLRNGKKCAHPEALLSADCVVRPAANKSLFSVKDAPTSADLKRQIIALASNNRLTQQEFNSRTKPLNFMAESNQQNAEPTLTQIMEAVQGMRAEHEAFKAEVAEAFNGQGQQQEGEDAADPMAGWSDFDRLSAFAKATDAELAQYNQQTGNNITRADINSAVTEYNSNPANLEGEQEGQKQGGQEGDGQYAGNYGGEQGAGEMAGAGAAAGAGSAQFQALHRELIQLKAKFNAKEQAEINFAEAQEAGKVEAKFIALAAQNKELREFSEKAVAQIEALQLHVRTGTRPVKAGVDSGIRLFSAGSDGDLHPYQQKLKTIQAERKCTPGQAITFADKEDNGALHNLWLQSLSKQTIHA